MGGPGCGRQPIDLHGRTFDRWTVLRLAPYRVGTHVRWRCRCACGREDDVISGSLLNGTSRSCGCLQSEVTAARNKTHGLAGTRTYRAWSGAKRRCANANEVGYVNYGGRGIAMAPEWRDSFETFYRDMGECPPGLSLERKDTNGHYCAANCVWATRVTQANNTRANHVLVFNGESATIAQWEQRLGFKGGTVKSRIYDGWPVDRALTTPTRGGADSFAQLDRDRGFTAGRVQARLKAGWDMARALSTPTRPMRRWR